MKTIRQLKREATKHASETRKNQRKYHATVDLALHRGAEIEMRFFIVRNALWETFPELMTFLNDLIIEGIDPDRIVTVEQDGRWKDIHTADLLEAAMENDSTFLKEWITRIVLRDIALLEEGEVE